MEFKIKYRKIGNWFWKTQTVIGYIRDNEIVKYNETRKIKNENRNCLIEQQSNDCAIFILPDKTQRIIPEWSKHEFIIGKDWLDATAKQMEKESGIKADV